MTRASLNRTLRRAYVVLTLVLVISLAAKFADRIPGIAGTPFEAAARDLYDYLKDMALVFVTVVAAYLANVFQKRSKFVESLEEEWRGIVRTKSALYTYCEKPYVSTDDYLAAFCRISETIDNMRIVYANAGETDDLVGLYPYAPLHDMRRALQSVDPRKRTDIPAEEKKLAREAILQSFYALRETMLEELDLDQPEHPLLISAGRRKKQPGATRGARVRQDRQRKSQDQLPSPRPDLDAYLHRLYEAEQASQSPTGHGAAGPRGV
ncbi:hypothetical protein [uncultured Hyphomicrobium sp.]|uniref:hypothetical protein n=1 Tax=uncultured Hyphomicrobium sp. TaxID=194373 RepID=UPI0025ED6BF7|nr:hypothetical protein [uncultured Hyphomicrobium sp.]